MTAITTADYVHPGGRLTVTIDSDPGYGSRPDLWPSVGEYPLYDPYLYSTMTNDTLRNAAFRQALLPFVRGRRVLDIGTGQDLVWALEAARHGAAGVVAVESLAASYAAAAGRLAGAPVADRITLVHGLSFDTELGERAQVCVAELIGSIASSEGILAALRDAWARLLAPGATVIPAACRTLVAAVSLRSLFPDGLAFSCDAMPYLRQIFDANGGPFDVRLAVANPAPGSLLTDAGVVEDLCFDRPVELDAVTTVHLRMRHSGSVDGLLCWIRLDAGNGSRVIDSLWDDTPCWVPAYLPLFDAPVAARAGDRITVEFARRTSDDGVHPDYWVGGTLHTAGRTVEGEFLSAFCGSGLGTAAVYRELFARTG